MADKESDVESRKIFLEELPRRGKTSQIDWKKSIGSKIKFIFNDVQGELPVLNYIREKGVGFIITEYNDCKDFKICTSSLSKCLIGEIIRTQTKQYSFDIGDIVENVNLGKLEILEQIRLLRYNGYTQKGYKYKCLICGNIDEISESDLNLNKGCNVCCKPSKKILKGYNDLWTTHPDIAKLLKFHEVGYELSYGSSNTEIFICPNCGLEKDMRVSSLLTQGLSCSRCGDGIPYPEKFLFCTIQQLDLEFITQLNKVVFDWCEDYKYDLYTSKNKCIIEVHGRQHYEEHKGSSWGSLEEIQENDLNKEWLAKSNNIKNYIVLDCRKSELEWVKNSIMNSRLPKLLNFRESDIDWIKCHEYACNSLVKESCKLWNDGIKSTTEIGKILRLDKSTIRKYLKQGTELGWCDYDPKFKRVVICLNTNVVYNSIAEISRILNINVSNICDCCSGRIKSAGKDPITSEKLVWKYL